MRFFRALLVPLIALATPAESEAPAPAALSQAERAQLQDSIDRGQLMYRYDQAAWHTTDAMVEHVPKTQLSLIKGWVVTDVPNGSKATYFGLSGDSPFVVYSAVWDGSKVLEEVIAPEDQRPPLTPEEQKLAAALNTARPVADKLGRCSPKAFNVVVLPGRTATDPVSVYFMTPQTKTGEYPLGGHYRIDVRGGAIVSQRPFMKSCFTTTQPPNTGAPAAFVITHLLDPIPTEIHVFSVFAMGTPLYVITKDRLFAVEVSGSQARVRILPRK
jgi:hypothetical protein